MTAAAGAAAPARSYSELAQRQLCGALRHEPAATADVRRFHNWVKAVAIQLAADHARRSCDEIRILDVGCGCGGDIHKLLRLQPDDALGIDASASSLRVAEQRRGASTVLRLAQCDFTARAQLAQLRRAAPARSPIQRGCASVVVCMFAIHHAASDDEGARCALDLLAECCAPGGAVACVMPSAEAIRRRLGDRARHDGELFSLSRHGAAHVVFHVFGSTPAAPEPLMSPARVVAELAERGLTQVLLDGGTRRVRATRAALGEMRRTMRCPEILTAEQWALADLSHVVVVARPAASA